MLLALIVSTQLPLPTMGLPQPETVIPAGTCDPEGKARVTVPLNGLTSVTVMVTVTLAP